MFNCNKSTIGGLLKRYDIPLRPMGGGKKAQIVKIEHSGELVDAKACTVCKIIKTLNEFNLGAKSSGGRQPKCKECRKKYHENNREHNKMKSKIQYYKNHEENKRKRRDYYSRNKLIIRSEQKKKYYINHEVNLENRRNHYRLNK